jgi:sugar/nucleoside kinase (ribokinase family)
MKRINISGTGCSLLDIIYANVDFTADRFTQFLCRKPGDGGINPGGLVFTEDLENFSNADIDSIVKTITGGTHRDAVNLGGPAIAALVNTSQLCFDQEIDIMFYAQCGSDDIGHKILSLLEPIAISTEHYKKVPGQSPYTIVLSDPRYNKGFGERAFINQLGVAADFSDQNLVDSFFDADILFLGGTAVVPKIHANLDELLDKGKAAGCLTVVATVFDFINEKGNPGRPWLLCKEEKNLSKIDLLLMNRYEAQRISGEEKIEAALNYYISNGVKAVLITQGPEPVLIYSDGSLFTAEKPRYLPISDSVKKRLAESETSTVDTTGCGDNFAGGVIAALAIQLTTKEVGELDLPNACAWGISSGGYACFYPGGVYHETTPGEKYHLIKPYVDQYLQQNKNWGVMQ